MCAYTVANPMVRLLCKHPSSFLPLLNSPGGHSRWGNPTAHLLHPCAKAAPGDKTYFQLITTDFKWALYIPRKSYYIFLVSSHSQSLRDYFTSISFLFRPLPHLICDASQRKHGCNQTRSSSSCRPKLHQPTYIYFLL